MCVCSGRLKVVLRKSCWDACLDEALLAEAATLNLLYIQTVADIERGWIHPSSDTKQQLALMQVHLPTCPPTTFNYATQSKQDHCECLV